MIVHITQNSDHLKVCLPNGTIVDFDPVFNLVWFHPSGKLEKGSYRVNMTHKQIDVEVPP